MGVIVATPTGSTAYALSGGGPILHPNLDAIVLVPICPHTLSSRPLVVAANSQVQIRLDRDDAREAQLTCDGQTVLELSPGDRIIIAQLGTAAATHSSAGPRSLRDLAGEAALGARALRRARNVSARAALTSRLRHRRSLVELDLAPGLTVLTGETGAGKSILVDALALVTGERASSDVVRDGAERCEVVAVFELEPSRDAIGWLRDA